MPLLSSALATRETREGAPADCSNLGEWGLKEDK